MKKFKTISMGLVLTMGLMTGLGATQVFADDQKVYKIACDQAYAPFSIQQDDGSYKGIDVELLAAIEPSIVPETSAGMIPEKSIGVNSYSKPSSSAIAARSSTSIPL